MPEQNRIKKIYAVPHFHFDVEWWKVQHEYSRDVSAILDKALILLQRNPQFKFVIDQALAIEPYLGRKPALVERFTDLSRAKRIEFVGGSVSAPDENVPIGESLIRQFTVGKKYFKEVFDAEVTTAWEIDEFGHSAQMPQILRGCGMNSLAFARGVNEKDGEHPVVFQWQGPDGTRILTHWFAAHYSGMIPLGSGILVRKYFAHEMNARLRYEGERSRADILMIPFGTDFTVPSEAWIDFVDEWNDRDMGPRVEFSLPSEYFEKLQSSGVEFPVVEGEFNPVLSGSYESREKVKKLGRKSQFLALEAEKFASMSRLLGAADYPQSDFNEAWWLILTNDFHDIMAGTGIDPVYRATVKRYNRAINILEDIRKKAADFIIRKIDTNVPDGLPLAVFNSLNWSAGGLIEVPLTDIPNLSSSAHWGVLDHESKPVASQISNGRLLFVAEAPSMGCRRYTAAPAAARDGFEDGGVRVGDGQMENEFIRLKVDPAWGGIVSLVHKPTGRELVNPKRFAAGELLVEEDGGNLWTIQKTGEVWRGRDSDAELSILEHGPIRGVISLRGQFSGIHYEQKFSLVRGLERVFIETIIDFYSKDRRIRLMMEPAFRGRTLYETPFCIQERGDGHWPAQNFAAVTDGESGLALLNVGSPGCEAEDGALGVTLMRSVSVASPALLKFMGRNALDIGKAVFKGVKSQLEGINMLEQELYRFHGIMLREFAGAGGLNMPGALMVFDHLLPMLTFWRESDAWERGRHIFKSCIVPFSGDDLLPVVRAGWELNNPLWARNTDKHQGELGPEMSFLKTDGDSIVSAFKRADKGNDFVLRVYDPAGRGADVGVELFKPIAEVSRTNFLEQTDEGRIEIQGNGFQDRIGPWKIQTYRLQPG